ncbi:MAG: class I SAM-dependent methyltransferase, partial [Chloroflexota bacterium]|nr:class I SAM-dependent methyltransferase [Chloroflexota bacterium]
MGEPVCPPSSWEGATSGVTDQEYLLGDQYKDAANLNARIQLHARFSTNPRSWHPWVFDQLDIPEAGHVLEVGCGPAPLWVENTERVPRHWQITLSDLSLGMLKEARKQLLAAEADFRFVVADAQSVPFPDESFDAAIANHMLY